MRLDRKIQCPKCSGNDFRAIFESTYVYSYKIDSPKDISHKENDSLPFLFDNREQKNSKQYIECCECSSKYPCEFTMDSKHIDFTILSKAVRSDYVDKPEFLG